MPHIIKGQKPKKYKPSVTWKPRLSPIYNNNFEFKNVIYVEPRWPIFGARKKGRFTVKNY